MRVLVVGCGYIGTPLAVHLASQGHEVHGLRRTGAADGVLRSAGVRAMQADITRPSDLEKLPGHYDWVVNCVASGGGNAEEYRRVYRDGTRNLLAWLGAAPPQKLVYTSSTGVYGQQDGSVVDETASTTPESETARVLLETEDLLLQTWAKTAFPSMILRVAGIYGPGRTYWMEQLLAGKARIEGSGERHLNMIHRDDVIGCIISALRNGRPGQIYNAVDDEPVSQINFLKWLAKTACKPLPIISDEVPPISKRGRTDKRVSNSKLKTELDHQFKYPTYREGYLAAISPPRVGV